MTSWWRKNVVGLAAVAVLLPATFGVIAWQEWGTFNQNRATSPLIAEPGDEIDFAGGVIGPAASRFYDDPDAPKGTRVVRVRVPIDPGDTPFRCATPPLRESNGAERQWDEASQELRRGFDDDLTFCSKDAEGPYQLTLEYLVPEDAGGPFYVDIDVVAEWPQFARLVIEPEGR